MPATKPSMPAIGRVILDAFAFQAARQPMGGNVINFNGILPALIPFDSNEESLFRARANVAVAFEASQYYPGYWIGGEIDGDGSVNNAIARLELGGSSPANTHRGPVLPWPDAAWDVLNIDNISAVNDALWRTQ